MPETSFIKTKDGQPSSSRSSWFVIAVCSYSTALCIIGGFWIYSAPENSPELPGRFIWDREQRPYSIIDFAEKDNEYVQYRYAHAVVPNPHAKEEVESAAKEIWQDLKVDIEATLPTAESKLIILSIYDSSEDGEARDGCHILQALFATGPSVPDWEDARIKWQWRDPKQKPNDAQLRLFHSYRAGLKECQEIIDERFRNKSRPLRPTDEQSTKEQYPDLYRRYAIARGQLAHETCNANGLDIETFARQIAIVRIWMDGREMDQASLDLWTRNYLEKWDVEKLTRR